MNTDFYKLSRGAGNKGPLYFQNLHRAIQFAKKDGAQLLKLVAEEYQNAHITETFLLENMDMNVFHKMNQGLNRTKKAVLMNQLGQKIGEIEHLEFFKTSEPDVESPTQQYVEKRRKK